ncbi:hypothetical protein Tco_1311581 [Tanacetum coccineum]
MIITNALDIRTARDLVSKDKMIWCGEVGGVEADLSVSNASVYSQLEGTGSSVGIVEGFWPSLVLFPTPRPPHPLKI